VPSDVNGGGRVKVFSPLVQVVNKRGICCSLVSHKP
jgi:hypothetical protein